VADEELGASVDARIRRLRVRGATERSTVAWRLARRYADDPEAAMRGLATALGELGDWDRQVALGEALPFRGSARDLATLLERLRSEALGAAAGRIVDGHLTRPLSDPALAARFETSGGKDGEVPGALALAGFARPREGPWAGRDRIVVLLFERMDAAVWHAARETYALLAADVADTPDAVRVLRERLAG
jgi:hypothetical protein